MADKEVDSNFFIFLPRVFTSNPVSDIDKGPRYSCFIGEVLSFFLIAQFRGQKRNEMALRDWQKRLLRFLTSVSVSCTELLKKRDEEANTTGYITCWPQNSSRVSRRDDRNYAQASEAVITARGDVMYPLHVYLDGLSALTKKIKLSVNVWTPELNVVIEDDSKTNILEDFLHNDPEIAFKELQSSFRCHVNACLPVVLPPTVRCRYTQVCGRHYLCVEVKNSLGEKMMLHQVNVHPRSHVEQRCKSNNYWLPRQHQSWEPLIARQNSIKHWQAEIGMIKRLTGSVGVIPIAVTGFKANNCKITLFPWEHHTFVFRIICHENHPLHKCVEVALTTSLRWSVETLQQRNQMLTTSYVMPVFNIRRSSLSVEACCPSSVSKGKRFLVKYTVSNTASDDCNVQLMWRPDSGVPSLQTESLVCLQPITRIGWCASGSSQSTQVEFMALEDGLHEVGKYMISKWHDKRSRDEALRPSFEQDFGQFTVISHSCQVFVSGVDKENSFLEV